MTTRRIRALESIVATVLASSAGVAVVAACDSTSSSSANDGGPILVDGGLYPVFPDQESFRCAAPLPANILEGLKTVTPVDYLELRESRLPQFASRSTEPVVRTTQWSVGTACATATNKDACLTAFEGARNNDEHGWEATHDPVGMYQGLREKLIFTRGNEVTSLRTAAEVVAFLGPIDSLEKAILMLRTADVAAACDENSGWRANKDGSWEFVTAGKGCKAGTAFIPFLHRSLVKRDGETKHLSFTVNARGAVCGRRPEGLSPPNVSSSPSALGEHFALMAHLEAASVVAFRRLEIELRQLRAPESLADRARTAQRDEIRHARDTAKIARKLGAKEIPRVEVEEPRQRVRSIVDIAIENATEGTIKETFGALVAAFQAERAAPELRPTLARIAHDEMKHAQLSYDIGLWLDKKLTDEERSEVSAAKRAALHELRTQTRTAGSDDVLASAGLPTHLETEALLNHFEAIALS
jgi:hypothetical protein